MSHCGTGRFSVSDDYDKDKNASVKDGKRNVAIKMGIPNAAKTELLSGLNEGQLVVLQ